MGSSRQKKKASRQGGGGVNKGGGAGAAAPKTAPVSNGGSNRRPDAPAVVSEANAAGRPSMLGRVSLPSAKDIGLDDRVFENDAKSTSDCGDDYQESSRGGNARPTFSESTAPAWELPVSPLDKAFRTRIGSPLGTRQSYTSSNIPSVPFAMPAALRSPVATSAGRGGGDGESEDSSEGDEVMQLEEDEQEEDDFNVPIGREAERTDAFKTYKDAIKRSILDVVGPNLRDAGFSADAGRLCFNKEILHQISEAIAKMTSAEAHPISVAVLMSRIKEFEGCGVRETCSFLIEYLCSNVEDLIYDDATEGMNSSRLGDAASNGGGGDDDDKGSDASVDGDDAVDAAEILEEDENITREWTHPLIVELLRKNASLRDYVKARTSGNISAEDAAKDLNASVLNNLNIDETMSFSSTESSQGSSDEDIDASFNKLLEAGGKQETGSYSINTGRSDSPLSPKHRSSPSTLDTSNFRSNESMTRDLLVPKGKSPSKRGSPSSNKEANIVDSLQKLSPMSDSERRRRRKHRSTPYDDSSSAGNETEEEMRKEKYKNAPYDDSSSADDDAEAEQYRRAKHQSLYHDDSTTAGGQTEEENRKQRHMNVPYDDSSTAGEETDDHDRKVKHEHLPYDDSSSAEDETDRVAQDAWGGMDQEELIRRKYRQDHQVSASPRNSPYKSASPSKVGTSPIKGNSAQRDEDYEFASSVVKYWDQLLLGPSTDLDTESENFDSAGLLNTSQPQFKVNATRSGSAPDGGASTSFSKSSPLAKSQSRDLEVTFDDFKHMSDQERHDYLYGTLESATQTAKRLDFIGSDYTETLKEEITDLANLLGLDPNEVLEGRVQEQMGYSFSKANSPQKSSHEPTKQKKVKRSKRAKQQQLEVSRLSLSSPKKPDVPAVMPPVSTLKQSPGVKLGPPKKSVRSSSEFFAKTRTASSNSASKARSSSATGKKSVPHGSVSYVSVSRSGARTGSDEFPNYYSDEAVPRDFSPSKQKAQASSSAYANRLANRHSQSRQTVDDTNIVVVNNQPYFPSRSGIQTRQRPSSAPPVRPSAAFKSPARAPASSSLKRPIFKVSIPQRPVSPSAPAAPVPPPPKVIVPTRQVKPQRKVRSVTSSLSAPTMSSLARANDILTQYLDFMVQSRPSIPWDQYSRKIVRGSKI